MLMTPLLNLLFVLVVSLTACNSDVPDRSANLSEGGLPPSQRTQEDSPAGVKFNEKTPFKSLSDSAEP
ncbi:MAG: hypothetical protein ACI9QV_001377 [Methylophagaceae bacterium]|jgi:hypothetical protein